MLEYEKQWNLFKGLTMLVKLIELFATSLITYEFLFPLWAPAALQQSVGIIDQGNRIKMIIPPL
jgi:hypothetical protein